MLYSSCKKLLLAVSIALIASSAFGSPPQTKPYRPNIQDEAAIRDVLRIYVQASETRNESLFKSILLNDQITLSSMDQAVEAGGRPHGTENYRDFRQGFDHPARKMRFEHIWIEQDGDLAHVSLTFRKASAKGYDWGLKSIQMLKIHGKWKIASELFTYH